MLKWAVVSAGLGTIPPVLYLSAWHADMVKAFPNWLIYFWPSSLWLLAGEGHEGDFPFLAKIIAQSLGMNAVMWAAAGATLCAFVHRSQSHESIQ